MKLKTYFYNFSFQFFSNILSQVIALFTIPYAARMLGVQKFGEFNLVFSFSAFAALISTFGFVNYASRELPRMNEIYSYVNITFSLRLILSTFSFLLMFIIGITIKSSTDFVYVSLIFGTTLLFSSLDMKWVYIAKDKLWKVALFGLLGQIFAAALLFLFVKKPSDIIKYSVIVAFSNILPYTLSFIIYIKEYKYLSLTLKFNKWRELLRESLPLGLSSVNITMNVYFSSILIGLFLSREDLGIYAAGYKLVLVIIGFYNLIYLVVNPTISRFYIQEKSKLLSFLNVYYLSFIFLGLIISLSLYLLSKFIILTLFGSKYFATYHLLNLWALFYIPLIPFSIISAASLIPCNASRKYFFTSLAGTISNLISIPIFIKLFGLQGAIFSSILCELVITVIGSILLFTHLNLSRNEILHIFNLKAYRKQLQRIPSLLLH